ncbi:hypothetical protein GCM10012275_55800 [Longimycelium tulufanense]|uniref:DUF2020 domain-containing protein n=1 Tax=Longimycelium tulufanense TaxID=907463 RepID=A0A8J3CHG7_9PSEU|nr:hypothetical protein GCM10012275_55800 [Longimycelium tulufanense]
MASPGERPTPPDTAAATAVELPAEPKPERDGPCPYLETKFVAEANGQKVGTVKVSADKPHPTCFFTGLDGKEQLRSRVYVGDPGVARELVDQAAPVSESSKAELTGGWKGGRMPTSNGSVFAVAKDGKAVVITSNQETTFKAQRIAQKVIAKLGL